MNQPFSSVVTRTETCGASACATTRPFDERIVPSVILLQPPRPHPASRRLLVDFAVGVLVGLAVVLDGLVPRELVLNEGAVLGVGGVELLELVALVIRANVDGRKDLLAADEEDTADDGVVVLAVDGDGAEDVLAGGLETSEEAACKIKLGQ